MKKTVLVFLISVAFVNFTPAQVAVDSLNVNPNPFQKRTSATYYISQTDTVSLFIYNVVGQNILNIKTKVLMSSGFYQDSIIMDAFADGIYFAVLKVSTGNTVSKKIIKDAFAGIKEFSEGQSMKVYPNPVSINLYIYPEQIFEKETEIEIINCLGQTVLKLNYSNEIDVTDLSQGLYTIKITTLDKHQYHSKFIKE